MADPASDPLKLVALDAEDLAILSAHVQDAVLRAGDIVYRAGERRFALALRRFDWEGRRAGLRRRRLAALHFERVTAARASGVSAAEPDKVLNLLAVTFAEAAAPAGEITLHFSEGAAIRLAVECIEAQMKDLGPIWEAAGTPEHPDA